MSERRFAEFSIAALEKLFDENRKLLPTLHSIAAELKFRKTKRAADLAKRVAQAVAVFDRLAPPEEEEPWSRYERGLSDAERAYILDSPSGLSPGITQGMSLWDEGVRLARSSEHTLVPAVRESLENRGIGFKLNAEGYGLAMRLAAFELRTESVARWPAFALLFRKMLGEKAVPWLPSLYLGAIALEPRMDVSAELEEIFWFRDEFGKGM